MTNADANGLWRIPQTTVPEGRVLELTRLLESRLREWDSLHSPVCFSTSLAAEDMVITDALSRAARSIRIFTLNTGRLHVQTLSMIPAIQARYGLGVEACDPDPQALAHVVEVHGVDGFYDSEEARHACCQVRKVQVLDRALAGAQAWITGVRRGQSTTRTALELHEWDEQRRLHKFNPLFDWSDGEVWAYLAHHQVPINPLHHKGYPSIGCEPCTRAIRQGEDVRAGRWWWLNQTSKECGLHVK